MYSRSFHFYVYESKNVPEREGSQPLSVDKDVYIHYDVDYEIDFEICDILDGVLHFEDSLKTDLQTDSWKKSKNCITGVIENIFEQCLEAHPDDPDSAVFGNPGSDWQIFQLQIYKTTSISDGLSVAFTIKYKDEKYYMCCTKDMKLYFKKGDCPDFIAGNRSEIIFFQKEFSEGDRCFKFQSSLQAGYYLAVSDEDGKQKLVLQKCDHKLKHYDMHGEDGLKEVLVF